MRSTGRSARSRAPPRESRPCRAVQAACETDCGTTYEADPSFLEFARREQADQPEPHLGGLKQTLHGWFRP